MTRNLNANDLEKVVENFLILLFRDHPELRPQNDERLNEIISNMVEILQNVNQGDFKNEFLADKEFLKELMVAFVAVLTLDKLSFNKETNLNEKLKLLLNKLGLDTKDLDLNDPVAVAKFKDQLKLKLEKLSPAEKAELKAILQPALTAIQKDLEKAKFLRPTPGKKQEEVVTEKMDKMENLFGLISSAVTGTIATIVPVFFGNQQGIVDMNPNQGMAQIDDENKPEQDNGNGVATKIKGNLLAISGDEFIEKFSKELECSGLAPVNHTPKPHMPGTLE